MSILNSIFDGLLGYEKPMLTCGFTLFVFALAAIVLGQTQGAQANGGAAFRLNPNIRINAAVLHVARMGGTTRLTER